MFSVKFDKKDCLLLVSFQGNFDTQQAEQLYKELENMRPKVRKGFRVVTDLSKLEVMDINCVPYIEKLMIMCNACGVSRITRIIPDSTKDIGFSIMSNFHYSKNVKIQTYSSANEARQHLILGSTAKLTDKFYAFLKIAKMNIVSVYFLGRFRLLVLVGGFVCLVILRFLLKAFGISLGYLYVTLISLSGFWFGVRGGVIAAAIASLIFFVEVSIFSSWPAHALVIKGIFLRFFVYFLGGVLLGYLSNIEKKLKENLERLSGYDSVTDCFNFKFIIAFLTKELRRSKRHQRNLTLVILDIDSFKELNDSYGHLAGNDILRAVAKTTKDMIRTEDVVGRYGGDEFIIIFPETSGRHAVGVLARIKAKLAQIKVVSPYINENTIFKIQFSAGLASFPYDIKDVETLVSYADNALYQAKKSGCNQIIISEQKT